PRANMVQALMAAKQYLIAKAILIELKGERPQDARIHHLLGKTLFELNEIAPAIASFQEAVALNPQDAESINWIGALKQTTGDDEAAQAAYAEAARIQPLISRQAAGGISCAGFVRAVRRQYADRISVPGRVFRYRYARAVRFAGVRHGN